jgi:hypothetical protein
MLSTEKMNIEKNDIGNDDVFYKSSKLPWVKGYVNEKSHMTLLFGFTEAVEQKHIDALIKIEKLEIPKNLIIDHVSTFPSSNGEPYTCIIGKMKITPEIQKFHEHNLQ